MEDCPCAEFDENRRSRELLENTQCLKKVTLFTRATLC